MDKSNVIYLVKETYTQNNYGVLEKTTEERKVFCNVTSVSGSEWFEGGRSGLNPELRFKMFRYDYNDEKVLKFNDTYYTIYRTYYDTNDEIELYTERRKGNEYTFTD